MLALDSTELEVIPFIALFYINNDIYNNIII